MEEGKKREKTRREVENVKWKREERGTNQDMRGKEVERETANVFCELYK